MLLKILNFHTIFMNFTPIFSSTILGSGKFGVDNKLQARLIPSSSTTASRSRAPSTQILLTHQIACTRAGNPAPNSCTMPRTKFGAKNIYNFHLDSWKQKFRFWNEINSNLVVHPKFFLRKILFNP